MEKRGGITLFTNALLVYKPVEKCLEIANRITSSLRIHGIPVHAISVDDLFTRRENEEALDFDLIVSIGGDGTFMKSAKYSTFYSLILPYPCGKRNAYYEQGLPDPAKIVERVLKGDFYLENIPLYQLCTGETCKYFVNDAVFTSSDLGKVAKFKVTITSHTAETTMLFEGDGVIIASSHGSSGHNLSARGPLVMPDHESLIITSLNPLQLGLPSIVAPQHSTVRVWVKNPTLLYTDGEQFTLLKGNSVVEVKHGFRYVRVIRFREKRNIWRSIIEPRQCVF